ncbi:hypothetical protein GCM10009555_069960 [Acrocarpospora macrocephala]|uniref:MmgE/PrpD N-terminal domain-containing protein n=1 Tax=Acrocarpospora macrocephala TaxID=150177 RepID=A0A5M3X0G1_9ACTN|nr:MmgE/PrpD family protein [Acrocarpospora macrocephala]GES13091.1 hypothetical protein Amac_066880 [Acrocarpospora macrocephala]
MSATRVLAEFVAGAAAGQDATVSLLDTLCAAIAGQATPFGAVVSALVEEDLGAGPVPVIGLDATVPAAWAAWASAGLAHASGMDDTACYGAAGAPVWSALLATAHREGRLEAAPMMDAFGVGVRAASALWRAGRYRQADRGFDGTSVFGGIAAAAACARLLGLSAEACAGALSIAASHAGGLVANVTGGARAAHAASAAHAGVLAASLAADGYAGAKDVFEARQGFGEAFFGRAGLERLADELDRPAVVKAGSVPGHADHQPVVRAVRSLLARAGADVPQAGDTFAANLVSAGADVLLVEVTGVPATSEGLSVDIPVTPEQELVSLRHTLTRLVTSRPEIVIGVNSRWHDSETLVRLRLSTGEELTATVGEEGATPDEVLAKWRLAEADPALPPAVRSRIGLVLDHWTERPLRVNDLFSATLG